MATVDRPATHRQELGLIIELAGSRYAIAVILITVGVPLAVYLWGNLVALFYVHVALGAFWFGLDFFFKFVLGPGLEAAPDDAAGTVNLHLVPRIFIVAEPLAIGVLGSGLGLAHRWGLLADPSVWVWGAIIVGGLLLVVGFGPLHVIIARMVAEMSVESPDEDRIEALFGKSMHWGLLQTVFMLLIIVMMTGLRNVGL